MRLITDWGIRGTMMAAMMVLTVLALCLMALPAQVRAEVPFTDAVAGIAFVPVKGGCYEMGDSLGEGESNERPVHEVCVGDFLLGKFEVTNEQFRKFRASHNSGNYEGLPLNDDKQPAVNISWVDAAAFARWLSEKTGLSYRLPSEAEWEYAARAGKTTSRFWGNNPDEACTYANVADLSSKGRWKTWKAHFCDDKFVVSAPVGSFQPNAFGLYDVLGNVWEWVQDVYDDKAYGKLPRNNPVFEGEGEYRVMRGGGWSNGPLGVRTSNRVGLMPSFGHHGLGFRLVRVK